MTASVNINEHPFWEQEIFCEIYEKSKNIL